MEISLRKNKVITFLFLYIILMFTYLELLKNKEKIAVMLIFPAFFVFWIAFYFLTETINHNFKIKVRFDFSHQDFSYFLRDFLLLFSMNILIGLLFFEDIGNRKVMLIVSLPIILSYVVLAFQNILKYVLKKGFKIKIGNDFSDEDIYKKIRENMIIFSLLIMGITIIFAGFKLFLYLNFDIPIHLRTTPSK